MTVTAVQSVTARSTAARIAASIIRIGLWRLPAAGRLTAAGHASMTAAVEEAEGGTVAQTARSRAALVLVLGAGHDLPSAWPAAPEQR